MLCFEKSENICDSVQQAIIHWVQTFSKFNRVTTIKELTSGYFFMELISLIPGIQVPSNLTLQQENETLTYKISIMKKILGSIIAYHTKVLKKNIDDFPLNYVELAMGSDKEIIRAIMLFVSALASLNKEVFSTALEYMPKEHKDVFQILVQNSLKIGEQCKCGNNSSSPSSDRDKILRRMEQLEDRNDELQQYLIKLTNQIEQEKNNNKSLNESKKQTEQDFRKLVFRAQTLEQTIFKLQKEQELSLLEKETEEKKITLVSQKYEKIIKALTKKQEQQGEMMLNYNETKKKLQSAEITNNDIKQQNNQLRQALSQLEKQLKHTKNSLKVEVEKVIEIKKKNSELELQIEELKIFNKSSLEQNQQIFREQGGETNRYRIKDSLSWIKNDSFYRKNNQNHKQVTDLFCDEQDSKSLQESAFLKENNGNSLNQKQNKQADKQFFYQAIQEDYSVLEPGQPQIEQVELLLSLIFDYRENFNENRRTTKSMFQLQENELSKSRKYRYINKLKKIFENDNQ